MPGMLGTELAAQLTGLRPGLPVLSMSGYAQPVLDAHGAFSDDIDLLEKPFPAAALLARVRQAIDTSTQDGADGTAGAAGPDGAPADGRTPGLAGAAGQRRKAGEFARAEQERRGHHVGLQVTGVAGAGDGQYMRPAVQRPGQPHLRRGDPVRRRDVQHLSRLPGRAAPGSASAP
jgi:hypothetical protein